MRRNILGVNFEVWAYQIELEKHVTILIIKHMNLEQCSMLPFLSSHPDFGHEL